MEETYKNIKGMYQAVLKNKIATIIIVTAIVGFICDITIPSSLAVGVLYVPIIFLKLVLDRAPPTNALLFIVIGMTIVGFLLPEISDDVIESLVNGTCVIFVAIGAAYIAQKQYDLEQRLVSSNHSLKQLFIETDSLRKLADISSKSKDIFISIISHEMRTPLNPIIGFADMIRNAGPCDGNPKNCKQYADYIYDAGTSLLSTIDRVIEFSALEKSPEGGNEDNVDLRTLVKSEAKKIAIEIKEQNINLILDMPDNNTIIRCDSAMVSKAIRNVVNNAMKFSQPGRNLTISIIRSDAGAITLCVADQGCGIPEDLIPKIGQPFLQADQRLSRRYEGLGIGLALTRRYMDYHQGYLKVLETSSSGTKIGLEFPASRVIALS